MRIDPTQLQCCCTYILNVHRQETTVYISLEINSVALLYCLCLWRPYQLNDIEALEKVQR